MKIHHLVGLVLLCIPIFAMSGTVQSGDWTVNISGDLQEAYTSNDSGSNLGVICELKSFNCVAYINPNAECNEGIKAQFLVNTDSAAFPITTTCSHIKLSGGKIVPLQTFDEFAQFVDSCSGGKQIGIAIPLEDGHFKVVRFSLLGASDAVRAARTKPGKDTKDVLM